MKSRPRDALVFAFGSNARYHSFANGHRTRDARAAMFVARRKKATSSGSRSAPRAARCCAGSIGGGPDADRPIRVRGNCYGCGVALQIESAADAGYVERTKYMERAKRKQTNIMLCNRCHELSNGKMVPGVEGLGVAALSGIGAAAGASADLMPQVLESADHENHSAAADARNLGTWTEGSASEGARPLKLLTPEELREQLKHLRRKKVLVLKLVDILDINGSFLSRVRDIVGSNPIILIATKSDLLPKGTDMRNVLDWLQSIADRKRLVIAGLHLVSCTKGEGIQRIASQIIRTRKGRDVYVLGAANVGKSSFIRALLSEMGNMQSASFSIGAISASRRPPTVSSMPGTTLGTIPLRVFEGNKGVLYDTAGLHLHHRLNNMLPPDDLKALHPKRRLKPYIASVDASAGDGGDDFGVQIASEGARAIRYKWGALVRS